MGRAAPLALLAGLLVAYLAAGQIMSAPVRIVPDEDLAEMRGGLILPSGLEIALAVRQDTSIDGALVLRTSYVVDQGAPKLSILTPSPGQTVPGTTGQDAQGGRGPAAAPGGDGSVVIDRAGGIALFQPGLSGPTGVQVNVTRGGAPPSDEGLTAVSLQPGESATTPSGTLTLDAIPGGSRIGLQNVGTEISHLVGQTIGTTIANSANDRTIDTVSVIDLNLTNVSPDLIGSGMLTVENVAVEAARMAIE